MKTYNMEQRSPEWYEVRRGLLTASKYDAVITATGKLSKSEAAMKFIDGLILDRFFKNDPHRAVANSILDKKFDIQWGRDHEDSAREWFADNVAPVSEIGFVEADSKPIGCSPDGLIPDGGEIGKWYAGLEIKCPALSTHYQYLRNGVLPDEYRRQVHGSMAVTGLDYWYFLSYYPGVRKFLIKVERDEFTEKMNQSFEGFVEVYQQSFQAAEKLLIDEREVAA